MTNLINTIIISNCFPVRDRAFEPSLFNLIAGGNGSGKTTLLKYIYKKYKNKHNIKTFFSSEVFFKNYIPCSDYSELPSQEYKLIARLPDMPYLVAECNDFFKSLQLDIKLDTTYLEGGTLGFRSRSLKKIIFLKDLSAGERVLFIFFLIIKSTPLPDILLIDGFDNVLSADSRQVVYQVLEDFSKQGVQIFLSTNKTEKLDERIGRTILYL